MPNPLPGICALSPYVPGRSIAEIREKYGLKNVVKLASNENPLGASPLAVEAVRRHAASIFRYPQGGNPRLAKALADKHDIDPARIVLGNGSDEIIDLLIRILAQPGVHNIVSCRPCFSIYPIQAGISGVSARQVPLAGDFSFDLPALYEMMDINTRLVFLTTPDNPSGYCPQRNKILEFSKKLHAEYPDILLVIDEAYMDMAPDSGNLSLLSQGILPGNTAFLRTFSKSYGLAGLRLGYGVLPPEIAECFWRARLPFSVNLLAEEAAIAALEDISFREATMHAIREGRTLLSAGLKRLGCEVWPSAANFIMFKLPEGTSASGAYEALLRKGIIIRPLGSYDMPEHFRVSIGRHDENLAFLAALEQILAKGSQNVTHYNN